VEEGESIPSHEDERYVEGALGEFALSFGNGYFIHGTRYEELLGQSVTHGCIRLSSDDLEFLAQNVEVGTPVLIF
jgi:L,D-transpeptidase YbiS